MKPGHQMMENCWDEPRFGSVDLIDIANLKNPGFGLLRCCDPRVVRCRNKCFGENLVKPGHQMMENCWDWLGFGSVDLIDIANLKNPGFGLLGVL